MPMLNLRLARPGRARRHQRRVGARLPPRVAVGRWRWARSCASARSSAGRPARLPLMAEALRVVGHAAIRNRGTVGRQHRPRRSRRRAARPPPVPRRRRRRAPRGGRASDSGRRPLRGAAHDLARSRTSWSSRCASRCRGPTRAGASPRWRGATATSRWSAPRAARVARRRGRSPARGSPSSASGERRCAARPREAALDGPRARPPARLREAAARGGRRALARRRSPRHGRTTAAAWPPCWPSARSTPRSRAAGGAA